MNYFFKKAEVMRIDLETLSCELKELNAAVHGCRTQCYKKKKNIDAAVGEQLLWFTEVRALLL